jgi:hypothetical protein
VINRLSSFSDHQCDYWVAEWGIARRAFSVLACSAHCARLAPFSAHTTPHDPISSSGTAKRPLCVPWTPAMAGGRPHGERRKVRSSDDAWHQSEGRRGGGGNRTLSEASAAKGRLMPSGQATGYGIAEWIESVGQGQRSSVRALRRRIGEKPDGAVKCSLIVGI